MSSISKYLLQRLVMMWHVLFYRYFKKHSIPSNNGQREIMHVIQGFDEWPIRIAKHLDCKTWLQFGGTEVSITKENIAYTLMGIYEHLWDICNLQDYNFDSSYTKYFFRPTHVWYEMVVGRNVTYIMCVFPFDYYMSLKYLQTKWHRWFSISESSLQKYKVRY